MNWIDYRSRRPLDYSRVSTGLFPAQAVLQLDPEEQRRLFQGASSILENPYVLGEQERFIARSKDLSGLFRQGSRDFLRDELTKGFGAVLVKGLPTDPKLPDTPARGGALEPGYKTSFISESMLLALGELTGSEPFNFRQEGRGKAPLIDNIVPIPELKAQKGAGGFDNNFPFHCESAWHRKRPDYLILVGVREATEAKTLVFSTQMLKGTEWVSGSQAGSDKFRLKAPDLYIQMQQAGIPMGTAEYSYLAPIEADGADVKLNINFNGTDCADEAAVGWLSRLEQHIEERAVGVVVTPGSALVLHNYFTCHTRTGYKPSFNGRDRWFLRGYFKNDLWKSHPAAGRGLHERWTEEAIEEIIKAGWMTSEGVLTEKFSKYVYNSEEIRNLEGSMAELTKVACHFTPISGMRIV